MTSFYQNNTLLAVSYLSSFPSGPAEGDFPENINYARGGCLAGFGDALMVCGMKAFDQFNSGERKFFQDRDEAERFVAATLGRWANFSSSDELGRPNILPNAEQLQIARRFFDAKIDSMF